VSEKRVVEVFYEDHRTWIFQRDDRGMPSASIQGDALSVLTSQIALGLSALEENDIDPDIRAELQEAFDYLWQIQTVYQEHGWIDLGPST
jgi:hypothetical protein